MRSVAKFATQQATLLIVLLSALPYQASIADTTLDYNLLQGERSKLRMSYQIKQQQIRITDNISQRINLYDHEKQQFTSVDSQTRKISLLNEQILNERVAQLNKGRLEHVKQVEQQLQAKLKDMTDKEKDIGTDLLNQIKYPDLYGEHTLLKLNATNTQKTIQGINCRVYQLVRQADLLKEYCVASQTDLGLTATEYKSLRGLYGFEYTTQSRLSLAMGKSNFQLVDFDKLAVDGIFIEEIGYKDAKALRHLILKKVQHKELDPALFSLPAATRKAEE